MASKKKVSVIAQSDLRRLMNEHKSKLKPKKIISPIAKYTESGQLTCTICSVFVNESIWDLHKKTKQHLNSSKRIRTDYETPAAPHVWKQPAEVTPIAIPKKLKGILKNQPQPVDVPRLQPDNDLDTGSTCTQLQSNKRSAQMDTVEASKRLKIDSSDPDPDTTVDKLPSDDTGLLEETGTNEEIEQMNQEEPLPEGFFDDPMLDAKARNIEYKNPVEEEWEKFQKEIKEETSVSAQIIAEDQDEATVERQIDEIDEQMRNWSRVLDLERKKEQLEQVTSKKDQADEAGSSSGDESEFEEFLDWRVKKAFK